MPGDDQSDGSWGGASLSQTSLTSQNDLTSQLRPHDCAFGGTIPSLAPAFGGGGGGAVQTPPLTVGGGAPPAFGSGATPIYGGGGSSLTGAIASGSGGGGSLTRTIASGSSGATFGAGVGARAGAVAAGAGAARVGGVGRVGPSPSGPAAAAELGLRAVSSLISATSARLRSAERGALMSALAFGTHLVPRAWSVPKP